MPDLAAVPGFSLWVSIGLHAAFILVAASVESGAPVREPGPPAQPLLLSLETSPPSFSLADPPVVIDFAELAEPEPPVLEAEDCPAEASEETETQPPSEVRVSLDVLILVEADRAGEGSDEPRGKEPAADVGSDREEAERADAREEERATPIRPPEFLSGTNRPPRYPGLARRRGYQGEVLLEIDVLADGSSGRIRVVRSSGYEILDEAAVEAARTWRFVPARTNAGETASLVRIPVVFRLE